MAELGEFEFSGQFAFEKDDERTDFTASFVVYNYGNDHIFDGKITISMVQNGCYQLQLFSEPSPPENVSYDLKIIQLGDIDPDHRTVWEIKDCTIDRLCWARNEYSMENYGFNEKCLDGEFQLKIKYSPPKIAEALPITG